ncbi:MAG TPA: hypothetical protein VF175_08350 [Lacipirellula sp.]
MPRITICPRCTSHLGLPADINPIAQVQCPICEVEFSLATVVPRELPQARVLDHDINATAAEFSDEPSPQERLSQLIRSTTPPNERDEAAASESAQSFDDAYQDADPELASSPPARSQPEEPQLGSSRLDQLLSDLIKSPPPTPPLASPTASTAAYAERQTLEADSPLTNEFQAELEDQARPPAEATVAQPQEIIPETQVGESDVAEFEEAEDAVVPRLNDEPSVAELPAHLRTTPRRKRRRSGVRTMVGIVVGGAGGTLLAAYIVLWLTGGQQDVLGVAKYLPASILPASAAQVADDDSALRGADPPTSPAESDEQASSLAVVQDPSLKFDPAVAPATAEQPIADTDEDNSLGNVLPQTPATPPTEAEPQLEKKTWPTTPIVGDLRGVKLYSVDELAELIPAADAAHREFLAGDLAREESWSTMGPAYMTIASLAERYTLVDPAAQGPELVTKQIAAKDIFRGLVGKPERRADLATVAARWLQHAKRLNQGVVLVGRVADLSPQGKWTQYAINVPLGDSFVTAHVLMDRIEFSAGEEVAVVGVILNQPADQLAGYEGGAEQVIVAGYSFAPEEFVAPPPGSVSGKFPFGASAGGE